MTTYIIYSDPSDGYILSRHTNYNTARAGNGEITVNTGLHRMHVGQNTDTSNRQYVYQAFMSFDTSVIPDSEEVVSASISAYTGWTNDKHTGVWDQYFVEQNWTAPLTAAQWRNPDGPNDAIAEFNWFESTTRFKRRETSDDELITAINKTAPLKLVSLAGRTVRGYAGGSTEIWMGSNNSTDKIYLVVHTLQPSAMNMISLASSTLDDGTTVSLRSSGGPNPSITLGYQTLTGAWTSLGALNTAFKRTIDGANSLAIVAGEDGDFYVLGTGSTAGTVVIQAFTRNGTSNTWEALTPSVTPLPAANGETIRSISASYMRGTGQNDRPSLRVITARSASGAPVAYPNHTYGSGWAQASTFHVDRILAGNPNPLHSAVVSLQGGEETGVPVFVDSVALSPNYCAIYTQRGKFGNETVGGLTVQYVEDVAGLPEPYSQNNEYVPTGASKLIAIDANTFAHVFDSDGQNLEIAFYNRQCQKLGDSTISAGLFHNSFIGTQWAAHYDATSHLVRVYHHASATTLTRTDISPTTFAQTTASIPNITYAIDTMRISHNADERRVAVESSSRDSTTTNVYYSTAGNVVPPAPTVTTRNNFDASGAATFSWLFSDLNPKDKQTAYQIQIRRNSDNVVVHDTGKVTSTSNAYTLPANTLANGVTYSWRIRLYDTVGAAGTYTTYQTFSTSATGTITILDPALDNQLGINTDDYLVRWEYSQIQSQRRVRALRTNDGVVAYDSGMQSSTLKEHRVTGLQSDVEYRIEVSIINSAGLTIPAATRLLTTSYAAPMTAIVETSTVSPYIELLITNPAPEGDRPEATYNDIYRRTSTPTALASDFALVGRTASNSIYRDYSVESGKAYDYRVLANGIAVSETYTEDAPTLSGVWIHNPANPQGTAHNFLYGNVGRTEDISIASVARNYIGRKYPVHDMGPFESQSIAIDIVIPSGPSEQALAEWFKEALRARQVLCYRDNRGRLVYGVIESIQFTDDRIGTLVAFTFITSDYSVAV